MDYPFHYDEKTHLGIKSSSQLTRNDRKLIKYLRSNHVSTESIERKLIEFIENQSAIREGYEVVEVDQCVVDGESLVFASNDSWQRLLVHLMCRYYRLKSETVEINGAKQTIVSMKDIEYREVDSFGEFLNSMDCAIH